MDDVVDRHLVEKQRVRQHYVVLSTINPYHSLLRLVQLLTVDQQLDLQLVDQLVRVRVHQLLVHLVLEEVDRLVLLLERDLVEALRVSIIDIEPC